ncbi:hypothetical protein Ping_2147 [Psychromonas ingrahamii 37]|uniref:Uncharacterized protein n=2 Tax=Psychromonas ingrahamii TaxID=357794 RepID=A1SWM5_PSYIN|nr:hypothetical protein Ping_2147 [Psychromonas ingrahamii 37]
MMNEYARNNRYWSCLKQYDYFKTFNRHLEVKWVYRVWGIGLCLFFILSGICMANVSAAPNESILIGRVIRLEKQANGKTEMQLKVEDVECIYGPCFSEKDQEITCFTFQNTKYVIIGSRIKAKVEYIGGPHNGQYQLLNIEE